MTFVPYDYQESIVYNHVPNILAMGRKPLIVLGTGCGKTAIAAMLAKNAIDRGEYVLICCCMVPLIMQFYDDLLMVGVPDDTIGILQGDNSDSHEYLNGCRVVVAMSQTLQSPRGAEFLANNTFHLFIGDERHRAELDAGEELVGALQNIGMTATPHRGDGDESMMNDFEWIQEITMQETIDRGNIIDYKHYFYPEHIEDEIFLDPQYVLEQWYQHLLGVPTLGFCKTTAEAQEYSDYFESKGFPCAVVCDETPDDVFAQARADFRSGAIHVIWSVTKIATGFNEPIAKGLMVCCKRKSVALWVQMIGRIVRKDGTGRRGKLLDFFNNGRYLPDPRDIVDWRDIPQASGKTCPNCGLKNSTKQIYCKGCGECLINDREKDEIKRVLGGDVDLDDFVRLHRPMVFEERRSQALDRVGVAKAAREVAFWELQCDPAWAAQEQKRHFPDETPIVNSQVLERAIFPDGMSPKDLAAYLEYLKLHAGKREDPDAWIKAQVRSEGGQDAIDMLHIAYAA